jgi:5-aminopentanamidase
MVTVICCELAPTVGDLEGNIAIAGEAIASAAQLGADVIVLPELTTSGYCFESEEEVRSAAIRTDHEVFGRWSTQAEGAVVVAGFAELGAGADDLLYNSAALIDSTGLRAVYRKTHLWNTEKLYFASGSAAAPVVTTSVGRIGLMICYDLEFPEMTRSVALRDADLLTAPAHWPWVDRPDGLPAPEVVIAMAAARVNRLPIACCDRRGVERGQRWSEATTIVDADGWPVASADPSGFAIADLDLAAGRDKRISERNDVFGDRRPSVY